MNCNISHLTQTNIHYNIRFSPIKIVLVCFAGNAIGDKNEIKARVRNLKWEPNGCDGNRNFIHVYSLVCSYIFTSW